MSELSVSNKQIDLFNKANKYIDAGHITFLTSGSIKLTFDNYADFQTTSHKLWLVNFNMTSLPKELTVYIRL